MLNFKKDPNSLMSYISLRNDDATVDKKEKIEYLKKHSDIQGYFMSGAYLAYSQGAELIQILWSLNPKAKNKDLYDDLRNRIKHSLLILSQGVSKWSSAKRPAELTKRKYAQVKYELYNAFQECINLLEEDELNSK